MSARRSRPRVTTRRIERRKRRRRAVVALGITAGLVAGTAYGTWRFIDENEYLLDERCEVTVGEEAVEFSPSQAHHAAMIAATAMDRGLPPEAAVHAIAISRQESDLRIRETENERDSRVLFARGTPSWSDDDQPQAAENSLAGFFDVLEDSWRAGQESEREDSDESEGEDGQDGASVEYWSPELGLDDAAAVLERPHNPQFYPRHQSAARAFGWPLTGEQPVGMTCYLSQLDVPGPDPVGAAEELAALAPQTLEVPELPEDEDSGDGDGDGESGDADSDDSESDPEESAEDATADDSETPGGLPAEWEPVFELTGDGEQAELRITPAAEDAGSATAWQLAHWAVASARDYGIQSVQVDSHTWNRDSARWQRTDDGPDGTTVILGFSRDR